jgi:hypothetical protein
MVGLGTKMYGPVAFFWVASTLCAHVFDDLRRHGIEVVSLGTGGDEFHAPARAFYDSLGMTPLPVVVYYKTL